MSKSPIRVVLCTSPPDAAQQMARTLLEEKLVACVNIVPGVKSLYWWKDAVSEDSEALMVIKTPAACYERLEARLRELHPYDIPEILSLAVERGADPYVSWVLDSTAS
ncbi:MAG: divalent-cation tolerance protein CutA [Deltaproteobacteria bacterium]|nr:divalent-cation tolerance protein CutA [Deltaproteobacteria bacterium]